MVKNQCESDLKSYLSMHLGGCIKSPNNSQYHPQWPPPKLAQAYNMFSFHCQTNFKPSEDALNNENYHTIKVSNTSNWYLKKKCPFIYCYVENDATRFHYPVIMSEKVVHMFSHPNIIWLGVITVCLSSYPPPPQEQCWRLADMLTCGVNFTFKSPDQLHCNCHINK